MFAGRYFRAISKKCFNCKKKHFQQDYSFKSDWHQYRVCPSCGQKVVCLSLDETPEKITSETEIKFKENEYFVYL